MCTEEFLMAYFLSGKEIRNQGWGWKLLSHGWDQRSVLLRFLSLDVQNYAAILSLQHFCNKMLGNNFPLLKISTFLDWFNWLDNYFSEWYSMRHSKNVDLHLRAKSTRKRKCQNSRSPSTLHEKPRTYGA